MRSYIQACPIIRGYLSEASRVTDGPFADVRIRKEFSYCNSSFWRPGVLLVGDSACFVDVLLSSGVLLATDAALLAARLINTCLSGAIDEIRCFNEYELRYRLEYAKFYQLLVGLYDPSKDSQTYHNWLRTWLRTTNAFVLEPLEPWANSKILANTNGQAHLSSKMSIQDSSRQVEILRDFCKQTLQANCLPKMEEVKPLPPVKGQLKPSLDRLHWVNA